MSHLTNTNSIRLTEKRSTNNVFDTSQNFHVQSNMNGSSSTEFKLQIDFVLVYNHENDQTHDNILANQRRQYYLDNAMREGLQLEFEEVHDSHNVVAFVKVHVPWEALCKWAQILKMEMPLKIVDENSDECEKLISWEHLLGCQQCCRIGNESSAQRDNRIYHVFDVKDIHRFQIDEQNRESFFPSRYRSEIAWEILQHLRNDEADKKLRGIELLIDEGVFECAYSPHEPYRNFINLPSSSTKESLTTRGELAHEWASWKRMLSQQPLNKIRDYFGEKIGFYYVFMDFYTKMLVFPALIGLIVFIVGQCWIRDDEEIKNICSEHEIPGNYWMCPICHPPYCEAWEMHAEGCKKYEMEFAFDNEATLALSCIVMLWAILFVKLWKRREVSMALDWNTINFQSKHSGTRPDYKIRATSTRRNPITSHMEPWVPLWRRVKWMSMSIAATFLILCFAGGVLAGLVVSRIALYAAFHKAGGYMAKHNIEASRWFMHGLIFLTITIFEGVYRSLVVKLTWLECPKTPHSFMTSLLWKLFIYELLIDFVPICYAAWLKGRTIHTPLDLNWFTELCDAGCIAEVVELVFVLLFLRMVVGNFLEIALPFLKRCIRQLKHTKHIDHRRLPQWLKDFFLNEVELDGVYEEYMEMMVQFAFVVLFPPVLPIGALICLVNNIMEIRIDAMKMLRANRKPLPLRTSGIHIWNTFLDIIVKLGVIFNAGIIAFTSDVIPRLYYMYHRSMAGRKHTGYTEYSLSYIHVRDWIKEYKIDDMLKHNISRCYYMGYREPDYPYNHKWDYWRIVTIRLTAFAAFSLGFFVIMYLVNLLVDDVPSYVRNRRERQAHLVKESLDEDRRSVRKAINNQVRPMFDFIPMRKNEMEVSHLKSRMSSQL